MEIATVARPYAEALFQIAQKQDLTQWSQLIEALANIGSHPQVLEVANNPNLRKDQIAEILFSIFRCENDELVKNFIQVLVDNDRVSLLPEIAHQFEELKNASQGAAIAKIATAFPLTEAQVDDIVSKLEKRFGRKLIPTVEVDDSLIGGICATVGDEVLDLSVRGKLQKMQETTPPAPSYQCTCPFCASFCKSRAMYNNPRSGHR